MRSFAYSARRALIGARYSLTDSITVPFSAAPAEPMSAATSSGVRFWQREASNSSEETSGRLTGSYVMCRSESVLAPLNSRAVSSASAASVMELSRLLLILVPSVTSSSGALDSSASGWGSTAVPCP